MILDEKQEHKALIEKTINYLEDKGYENIKADIDGYETPKSFKMPSKGIEITPDIVAENNGRVQYIEVGLKSQDIPLLKTKWKFLKTLAELKNRNFRVIAHKGSYGFSDKLMNEINLNKSALRI
ncbi:hypothetical protein [Crocinitomix algicola]|uniref:hypothetical protein n=1 Tax=Crocinitomix algicola TaxID=1740263 RepID=UPI0008727586|nr:hypothetical protein [Crocinitomix algicola]